MRGFHYLQLHVGSDALVLFTHCATSGALHETSQRLPLTSVLHEVVELFEDVEFVVVPPTLVELLLFTELVTFDEVLELTELVTFDALRVSPELAAPAEVTLSAEPHAQSASTIAVRRYLMVGSLVAVDAPVRCSFHARGSVWDRPTRCEESAGDGRLRLGDRGRLSFVCPSRRRAPPSDRLLLA
jgi:hypothetical protein